MTKLSKKQCKELIDQKYKEIRDLQYELEKEINFSEEGEGRRCFHITGLNLISLLK